MMIPESCLPISHGGTFIPYFYSTVSRIDILSLKAIFVHVYIICYFGYLLEEGIAKARGIFLT